jgi:NADPH2:quinone reductase
MTEGYFLVKHRKLKHAFSLRSIPITPIPLGSARIRIEAFGLNFADVMARRGKYRDAPPFPFVPGYDIVGVVVEVNSPNDQGWVGKRVAGFCRFGAYAQSVVTPLIALVEIGEMLAEDALSLCTAGVTASFMVGQVSELNRGKVALVHAAAGGVGSIILQLLAIKGIKTVAKVSTIEKARALEGISPTWVLVSPKERYHKDLAAILDQQRIIASFNPTGGISIKQDLQFLSNGGKLFLFGGSSLLNGRLGGLLSLLKFAKKSGFYSPIPFMMKSQTMVGVNMLKIAEDSPQELTYHLNECFSLYHQKKIVPLKAQTFHHTQLVQAHELMESRKSTGKVVILWDEKG